MKDLESAVILLWGRTTRITSTVLNRKQDPASLSRAAALPCHTAVMKFVMTPNKLEVTLTFPTSKIMPCILPKSKEVMNQSSWNKTAAKIRPQSKLPFLRIMKASKDLLTPFILFPLQPTTLLTLFVKITKFLVAVEMNSNDDL